jgi:hypothetical protein
VELVVIEDRGGVAEKEVDRPLDVGINVDGYLLDSGDHNL